MLKFESGLQILTLFPFDLHKIMNKLHCFSEIHKNVISPLEGDVKEHVLHQKHDDLKQRMRDLNQGFERLRKITHEGYSDDTGAHLCKQRTFVS